MDKHKLYYHYCEEFIAAVANLNAQQTPENFENYQDCCNTLCDLSEDLYNGNFFYPEEAVFTPEAEAYVEKMRELRYEEYLKRKQK